MKTATIDEIVETGRYLNNELTELKRAKSDPQRRRRQHQSQLKFTSTMIHESRTSSLSLNLSKVSRKFFAGL